MFPNLSRRIAALYIWLGLISILFLTVVTTVSVANVFTSGQLIQSHTVQVWWSIIFAASIEVNIVRLFYESKRDNDKEAKKLGIGLIVVAGVSLIIEGMQQSIGFDWYIWYIQLIVGLVVSLRVFFVMFLLAREGSRLATMTTGTEQPLYACLVDFAPQIDTAIDTVEESVSVQQIGTSPVPLRMISSHKDTDTLDRVRAVLKSDPSVSVRVLADKAGVSPGTAQKYKSRIAKEA